MGPAGWLVTLLLAVGVLCVAVAWPLAAASSHGHVAAWGWAAEAAWLVALMAGLGWLAASRRR
jgi:hypothetical protein